jgi:hypothetical protein
MQCHAITCNASTMLSLVCRSGHEVGFQRSWRPPHPSRQNLLLLVQEDMVLVEEEDVGHMGQPCRDTGGQPRLDGTGLAVGAASTEGDADVSGPARAHGRGIQGQGVGALIRTHAVNPVATLARLLVLR